MVSRITSSSSSVASRPHNLLH
jgi:nucleotide-binding universal stress UspA family protein